jgi:hypothetical protein
MKSGASGQLLNGSPSNYESIKYEGRSYSNATGSIRCLKLPQLKNRNYVPSTTKEEYELSKVISHKELRRLEMFKQGLISPYDLGSTSRTILGIKAVHPRK